MRGGCAGCALRGTVGPLRARRSGKRHHTRRARAQGVVFDRFVELDYEEVAARKARAIMTRDALGATLRQGNAVDDSAAGQGCISSAQYTLAPADLRHLEQARAAPGGVHVAVHAQRRSCR